MVAQDIIVVGAGMVGSAIAWGFARHGHKVIVVDGADESERAARANFGLVWGQSKGDSLPEYALWTREALGLWPAFQDELLNETGVDLGFSGDGGLHLCMSDQELEDRRDLFSRLRGIAGGSPLDLRILDRHEVADIMPGIGQAVVGAGYCRQDGHASPHAMLMAMHRAILRRRGVIHSDSMVTSISRTSGVWSVATRKNTYTASVVILAAGTGNKNLGRLLGIDIPVFGLKGQILVTERVSPRIRLPTHKIRQTEVGTILLGDSKEPSAGSDDRSSASVIGDIADRCLQMLPWLADVNLVRSWGGIRSMTADGYPIYDSYADFPGLFSASCHSGVTLAPVHALHLAPQILENGFTKQVTAMSARRFHVQAH